MRTEVRIVARPGAWPRIHATGGLAARHTAPDTVHLVGTAATPVGGDHIEIVIEVESGASLRLRTVAATLALPGRLTRYSSAHWLFEIGEGGELDVDPEPTIVAGGAAHQSVSTVRLAPDARLYLRERVQIGRINEDSGTWRGDLVADIGDVPLLRHRLDLGADTATDDCLSAPRALTSVLRYPDDDPASTGALDTATLPLAAGGSLYTWTGSRLATRHDDHAPSARTPDTALRRAEV
ncbi:urease accessory protein UreD [Nocardia alni]|uniref:urease accessory protein UreD n=1 Tax=Nocardia alni TaxID=2815723 RepID=UPI001C21A226|nr:urease accessory protein UreD [Nocardia alni]